MAHTSRTSQQALFNAHQDGERNAIKASHDTRGEKKRKKPTEQGIASKSPRRTHRKPYNQSPWPLRFLQSALIGNWSSGAVDVARSACHPSFQNLHRPPKRNDGVSVSSLTKSIAGDCSGKTSPTRLPGMPQAGSALSRTRREMKAGECTVNLEMRDLR